MPKILGGEHGNLLENWLEPIYMPAMNKLEVYGTHTRVEEILLMAASAAAALSAIYFALHIYTRKPDIAVKVSSRFKVLYNILLNKYFVDEIYDAAIVNPVQKGSERFLWKFFDMKIIDGAVNGIAALIDKLSGVIKKVQTGLTQSYALIMMAGIALVLLWLILSI